MAQFALKAGNLPTYNEANAKAEQQANFDTPVNPIFKNELTAEASIVCYEVRKGNTTPAQSATNGVSYSNSSLNFLNRKYPNTTTVADYLENLDRTQGHRIQCYQHTENEGQSLASDFLNTFDMFVILFADDYKVHHVAKITSVDTEESAGDSFTFQPAYNGEIPKGTKFQIYQGPLTTVTDVVAVGYGLQGDGTDDRHDVYTVCARPNFYFYDSKYDMVRKRLKEDGQLDFDTKYKVFYSRKTSSAEVHDCTCFVTEQQYGLRAIDYSQHQMKSTLVDNLRTADTPTAASTPQGYEKYGSTSVTAFNYDFTAWNECFPNIKRSSGNLTKAQSGDFNGPTRYIHYSKSPDKTNVIPRVLESNVFDSVTKTGTFGEARISDPHKIMGKKIRRFDEYRVKETIAEGRIEFAKNRELPGSWTTDSSNNFVVSGLEPGHSLNTLLFDDPSSTYEEILIGDYHYRLGGRGAVYTHSNGSLAQNWQIAAHRLKTAATWTVTSTLPVAFSSQTAFRRAWSKATKTLIVDFPITAVFNDTQDGLLKGGYDVGTLEFGAPNDVYGLEIVLSGGNFTGITLLVNAGEKNNSFINFQDGVLENYQDPTSQMYQKLSLDYPNILDYFQGSYVVNKVIFKGSIENIEEYVEEGQHKFYISGRSDVSKLLGPVINKDHKFSDDWIYSTASPISLSAAGTGVSANARIEIGQTSIVYTGTLSSSVSVGDYLFGTSIGFFAGSNFLIGRISNINTGTSTITLEEGSLSRVGGSDSTPALSYTDYTTHQSYLFSKAMGTNSKLSSKTTSLLGALDKGVLFNSGKKITVAGADSTKLIDSSSSTNKDARGYYIHQTESDATSGSSEENSSNAKAADLIEPYMAKLTNGGASPTYSNFNTINSIGNYEVVNLSRSEGDTIVELAPVCPAVLGRLDFNPADSRALQLTQEMTTVDDDYAIGYHGVIVCDGTDPLKFGVGYSSASASGDATEQFDSIGHYIYNSSGQVLGRIIKARWKNDAGASNGYTLSDGSFNHGEILLDRPLPAALSDGDKLYVPYSGGHISHGLYLLNTQGLRTGGYVHAMNSSLSSATKPIQYSVAQSATNGSYPFAYGITESYNRPTMRYIDLQKGGYGTFTYKKHKLLDGKIVSPSNSSNVNAYASVFFPNINSSYNLLSSHWEVFGNGGHSLSNINRHDTLYNQGMPQSRGIYPAHGSNFEDYRIYSPDALTPGYRKLAQFDATDGGPWVLNASSATNSINGWKDNAISEMRDNLEIIDPNMLRWFIFAPGDIHPESMTRWNHIGFTTRDFTDYNLILKNTSAKESVALGSVDNSHTNYLGSALSEKEIDSDYQTITMSNASITPDQMKRVGIMRLKELTMDWHFNAIDTETTIDYSKGIDTFYPRRFLTLEKPAFFSDTSNNPTVTATSSYHTDGSKRIDLSSNSNFKSGSSGDLIFNNGDRVYAQDGSYIGTCNGTQYGSYLILADEANLVNGKRYCSANDNQDGILYIMRSAGSVSWADTAGIYGKSGKSGQYPPSDPALESPVLMSSLANLKTNFEHNQLINTQGVVFNGEYPKKNIGTAYAYLLGLLNGHSYFGVNPLSKSSAGFQFPPFFGVERDNDSTIDVEEDAAIGAQTVLTVDNNAESKFKVGDELYTQRGFLGIIASMDSSANTITLTAPNCVQTSTGDAIYLGYKSILSRTHIFFNALEEQKGITGSRVLNGINIDLDDSANCGVANISLATGHGIQQGIVPTLDNDPPYHGKFSVSGGGGSNFAAKYILSKATTEFEFFDNFNSAYVRSSSGTYNHVEIFEIDLARHTGINPRKYTYKVYFNTGGGSAPSAPSVGTLVEVVVTASDTGQTIAENFFDALSTANQFDGTEGAFATKGLLLALDRNRVRITNACGGAVGADANNLGHFYFSSNWQSGTYVSHPDAIKPHPIDFGGNIIDAVVTNSGTGYTSSPTIANLSQSFTDATCDTNSSAGSGTTFGSNPKIVQIDSTDNLAVGMAVSGTGIASGSFVSQIDSATLFRVTLDTTATNNNQTLTFTERPVFYRQSSSHTFPTISHIAHLGSRVYQGMKAVVLNNYEITGSDERETLSEGTAVDLGLSYTLEKHKPQAYSLSTFMVNTENNFKNSNSVIKLPFAGTNRDGNLRKEDVINYRTGFTSAPLADGANFVIKPLLHLDDSSVGVTTAHNHEHKPSGNGTATLRFDVSNNATQGNLWLRYCPNLTGCYLVSSDGYQYGTSTGNWTETADYEGTWSISTAADVDDASTASPEGLYPRAIHYISAHEVVTTGSTQYHDLIVDNWNVSSESLIFRVMQPAETCFWENTPASIDMYKMTSRYTKKQGNSGELYDSIGQFTISGEVSNESEKYGMNEGIQSMYVFVDMDPKSGSLHLVPRTHSAVVGSEKKFVPSSSNEDPISYNMYLTDGITKTRKTFTFTDVDTYSCTLNMGDSAFGMQKMAGIVSAGEIFTVTTNDEVNLDDVESASIGTSVTVAPEAETIIKDLMKSNSLSYSDSSVTFPYFTGIKVTGADLYNTVTYLASLKDKTLNIRPSGLSLDRSDDRALFTDIVISNKSNDVKILDLKKNQSMYDFYNEIIVYGSSHKATRRDRRSIQRDGKKTLEKIDDSLTSQSEVDKEAKRLLMIHAKVNNRITIKTINRGIELLKSGQIVLVDLPDEEIYSTNFMVLEMQYDAFGVVVLELGQYDKNLSDRLAELLMANKRVASVLRGDRFKAPKEEMGFLSSMKIKAVKLIGRRTHKQGSPFTIGFNYPIDIEPSGGTDDDSGTASYPLGFNESLGSVVTTVIVDEDLV